MNNKNYNFYKHSIEPVVVETMKKKGMKPFWYEVWIDLDERFDSEVWPAIEGLPVDAAAKWVLDWLIKQDNFYASPHYTEMLDRMLDQANSL